MPRHTEHIHLTDEELLQAYRADGDKLWLGRLLQRYTTLLLGVSMKYLKDRTLAEDAVQQIFLKVLTYPLREEILNFKGWLYVLTRNYCLQQLRDKTRVTDESVIADIPATDADKDDMAGHERTLERMSEAIERLPEEQRIAITLFYLKRYSYEQIIAQTGYTFMQVKSYVQNGKRNIKNSLQKSGTRP